MTRTKASDPQGAATGTQPVLNPGDKASPGTPGTGDDLSGQGAH
ncbi:hypothetical protein [Bradyrhizobium sp.]